MARLTLQPPPRTRHWAIVSPWFLLLAVSIGGTALALIGPVAQLPSISWSGAGLQAFCLVVFWFAYSVGKRISPRVPTRSPSGLEPAHEWITVLLLVGIVGAALQVATKLDVLDGLDLSSIFALRNQRAMQLASAERPASAGWAAVGFLTYPAGVVGLCAIFRWYERMYVGRVALAAAFGASLMLMTLLMGGRGPLISCAVLLAGVAVLRVIDGLPVFPRSRALRWSAVLAVMGILGYSTIIWTVRSDAVQLDAEQFLVHAESAWGMTVRSGFRDAVEPILGIDGVRALAVTSFYISQSTAILERIIAAPASAPMLGMYEADVVAATYRVMAGADAKLLVDGNQRLLDANIYGFFSGAWGGLVIDFGYTGAMAAITAWGWMAGRAWGVALRAPGAPAALMLAFWLAASIWSFATPPLGFSNAAVIFAWFIVFAVFARPSPNRQKSAKVVATQIQIRSRQLAAQYP